MYIIQKVSIPYMVQYGTPQMCYLETTLKRENYFIQEKFNSFYCVVLIIRLDLIRYFF